MSRLVYFLMVGLAFAVLQVSTVGAQSPSGSADPNAPVLTIGDPACITVPAAAGCPPGSPGLMGAPGMPPTGMPPMGDSCMTVPAGPDRDACYSSMSGSSMPPGAPHMSGSSMPPGAPGMPPTMAPPGAPGMHGDTAALRACKQIKPRGSKGKLRQKKDCFRKLAKSLGAKQSARAEWKRCKQIRPKGKLGKLRNKKNCFRDLARSLQHGPPTGAPGMPPMGDASMAPPMAPPMGAPAITGKRPGGKMGNYGCGQPNRRKHVNCLRRLLDTTPHGATVRKGTKGLGKYGCHDKKRRKHVNCLRRLLDQHGPHLAKGGKRGMAPGTN